MRPWIYPLLAVVLIGCGGEKTTAPSGGGDPGPSLGSAYPDAAVIDADNPVYADDHWAQETVTEWFAFAKDGNQPAYRAYKAANAHADLLEWAFCKCGCEHSDSHVSAVDCFKDMHGYG